MKHVRVRIGNPKKGGFWLSVPGRSKKKAVAKARHILRTRLKNISEGFHDSEGRFHPIRSAVDYSPARAGEKRGRAKYSKRPAARSQRARRHRHGAIS